MNAHIFKPVALTALLPAIAACTSTEVTDPSEQDRMLGEEITLSISTPEASASTRADDTHKLRYTAKLFRGDYKKEIDFIERKEEIASDGKATITFNVSQEGTYSVILFADYLPANANPDASAHYEDRYYDTTSEDENFTMLAFYKMNGPTPVALDYGCVNNDNYDAFAAYRTINKTEEKFEVDVTLNRVVSKVRVVSNTDAAADVSSVSFSRFSFVNTVSVASGTASGHAEWGKMNLANHSLTEMSDKAAKELFYFYTLADDYNDNFLDDLAFSVRFSDGTERTKSIDKGTIKVRRNYITTLQGPFLADPPASEKGDIVLNLSSENEWNFEQKEIPFN